MKDKNADGLRRKAAQGRRMSVPKDKAIVIDPCDEWKDGRDDSLFAKIGIRSEKVETMETVTLK